MKRKNLALQLAALREHPARFAQFAGATHPEFVAMAQYLIRRWTPPSSFSVEDLVQELYLGVWLVLPKFDPSRATLVSFVVFNAMSHAKRELHRARGAKLSGSADRNNSHFERPVSSLGREDGDGESLLDLLLSTEPDAERLIMDAESRADAISRALRECSTARERVAILALDEGRGDVDAAASVLYDDMHSRIALQLGSREQAERYVIHAAASVAARLAAS